MEDSKDGSNQTKAQEDAWRWEKEAKKLATDTENIVDEARLSLQRCRINEITKKICHVLIAEMAFLNYRKKVGSSTELKGNDKVRYDILEKLNKDIHDIANAKKDALTIDTINAWKSGYKSEVIDTIGKSLNEGGLDKYGYWEKIGKTILNIFHLCLFPISLPIKYGITRTWLYSTEGKPKEAVNKAHEIALDLHRRWAP